MTETERKLRLMNAAPNMLYALRRALPVLIRMSKEEPKDTLSGYRSPAAIACDEARKAIALATGEAAENEAQS